MRLSLRALVSVCEFVRVFGHGCMYAFVLGVSMNLCIHVSIWVKGVSQCKAGSPKCMKHSPGFKASVRSQKRPAFVRKHILFPCVWPACWLYNWAALNTCCYPGRSLVSAPVPHRTEWVGSAREADREVICSYPIVGSWGQEPPGLLFPLLGL